MQKNIRLEKPANATELPAGWYKREGFNIWYYRIFGIEFEITNTYDKAPGVWYIKFPGMGWNMLEHYGTHFVNPTMESDSNFVVGTAYAAMCNYLKLCISRVENDLENISKI